MEEGKGWPVMTLYTLLQKILLKSFALTVTEGRKDFRRVEVSQARNDPCDVSRSQILRIFLRDLKVILHDIMGSFKLGSDIIRFVFLKEHW